MVGFKKGVAAALVIWATGAGSAVLLRAPAATAAPEKAAGAKAADHAAKAKFEVYKDKADKYRWRLRAQNSQVIASSGQGYADKRSCTSAIESVKRNAADAPVEEVHDTGEDAK